MANARTKVKKMENEKKCISNTKNGKCVECGKVALLDANNKDKRYVCEICWYELGYDKINGG